MKKIDVFNGDADGICALHQMRLAEPADSVLVTGVKRDIQLVRNVVAEPGDEVLVLDISLAKNINAVNALLDKGCSIQYFDHHLPGEIPDHQGMDAHINTSPETCTSILVSEYLDHRFVCWAIAAAYGDNMTASAEKLAEENGLSPEQKLQLKDLGICLNYNGYGATLDDLHFTPEALYQSMQPYQNPFDFISNEAVYKTLKKGYDEDMARASALQSVLDTGHSAVFELPNEKWCRRVSGVLGNDLSNNYPERAHALITETGEGVYQVSVRAPQSNKTGAGDLCSQFATGGGREGAAGINALPEADKNRFIEAFTALYG